MQASRIAKSEERENLFIFYRFLKSKNNLLLKALPEVVLSLNKDFFSAKTNHFRMLSFFVKYFFRKKKNFVTETYIFFFFLLFLFGLAAFRFPLVCFALLLFRNLVFAFERIPNWSQRTPQEERFL